MNISQSILELKEFSELAYNILQSDTGYLRSKNLISDIFSINRDNRLETIIFRLTIIDSYYSTQMNKRFFGIEDLAKELKEIAIDDETLISMSNDFISDNSINNDINKLFKNKFGIRKTGHNAGHAASLISKYLYFLTDYEFPIYDNLVTISYPLIKNKYPELNIINLDKQFNISYFDKIKKLNITTKINDYNRLDNLLWLLGKLTNGSLSLILDKVRYLKLIKMVNLSKGTPSRDADTKIREFIRNNIDYLYDIFNDNEIKFLKYSHGLNNNGC